MLCLPETRLRASPQIIADVVADAAKGVRTSKLEVWVAVAMATVTAVGAATLTAFVLSSVLESALWGSFIGVVVGTLLAVMVTTCYHCS